MTSGWQPIETAPKDGITPLLVFVPSPMGHEVVVAQYVYWDSGGEGWSYRISKGFSGMSYDPSHWMPLPPPPTETDQ